MTSRQMVDAPGDALAHRAALPTWILLGALAAILLFAGFGSTCDWTQPATQPGQADWNLFESVVQRVKAGEPYYAAFTAELHARGYPSDRVFNWRTPLLTLLLAGLPSMQYARGIIVGLIGATLALWISVLRRRYGGWHALAGSIALAVVLLPLTIPSVMYFSEAWAGLLIVLSLGAFAAGLWRVSVAAGVAALCLRELALPYVLVMLLFATLKKHRPEQIAWSAGLLLFGALLVAHRVLVDPYLGTPNPTNRWLVFGGSCFVALTGSHNAIGVFLPGPLRASAVAIALLGFTAWRDSAGSRAAVTVLVYTVAFLFAGRPDNGYWGFIHSPVLFLGFVFVPAALIGIAGVIRSLIGTRIRRQPAD